MSERTSPTRCAVCGAPLAESESAPHAPGEPMIYHADYDQCLRFTLAQLAARRRVTPMMAAAVGAEDGEARQ